MEARALIHANNRSIYAENDSIQVEPNSVVNHQENQNNNLDDVLKKAEEQYQDNTKNEAAYKKNKYESSMFSDEDTIRQENSSDKHDFDTGVVKNNSVFGRNESKADKQQQTLLNQIHRGQIAQLKVQDGDLEQFLSALKTNTTFSGTVDLSGQHLTDQSLLKISTIIEAGVPLIQSLCLNGNTNIGTEGVKVIGETISNSSILKRLDLGHLESQLPGVYRLVECLTINNSITEFDMGIINGDGLRYLGDNLSKINSLNYLTIQESETSNWTSEDKQHFIDKLEQSRTCPILSINVLSPRIDYLEDFIGILALIFEKRRALFLLSQESEQQSKALEIEATEVENIEMHDLLNSFSTKKYIDNIFKNKLEESLILIEKHQANILRSRRKKEHDPNSSDKIWEESDLFTAEGCCYALASFLLQKKDEQLIMTTLFQNGDRIPRMAGSWDLEIQF